MATVKSIALVLTADLREFTSGLDGAGRVTERYIKRLRKTLNSAAETAITGFGNALKAGLLGGTAVIAAATALGVERLDQLGDTAGELGIVTTRLSELRYAATLTGSSGEALDAALSKLNANLGDAATKATPAGDALKRLGLDARELAEQDPDVAFRSIAEAISHIPNPAEKAALALDLFGKGGIKILNTLSAGKGELDRLAAEARRFGVAVSEVDQAKVAAAKDQIDRAWASLEGVQNKLTVGLAPAIAFMGEQFVLSLGSAQDGMGEIVVLSDLLIQSAGGIADAWNGIGKFFVQTEATLQGLVGLVLQLGIGADFGILNDANEISKGVDELNKTKPSDELLNRYDKFKKKLEESAAAAANLQKQTAKFGGLDAKQAKAMEDQKKFVEDLSKSVKTPLEEYQEQISKIEDALAKKLITPEIASRGRNKASDEFYKDDIDKQKKVIEDSKSFAEQLKDSTRTPLEQLQEELAKINRAQAFGHLDSATAARGRLKALSDFTGEPKFAAANQLGSREVYSSMLAARTARPAGISAMERTANQQLAESQKQTGLLATIAGRSNVPKADAPRQRL